MNDVTFKTPLSTSLKGMGGRVLLTSLLYMDCYSCNTPLIWGGDEETDKDDELEKHNIVTNLSCPNCKSFVLVYHS